jgi:hypothetical protein
LLLDERYATQTRTLDATFAAQDKAVQAALTAAKEAAAKAEAAAEKRFESVNEFRAQLSDQANTFLPRTEYDAAHQSLSDKIDVGLETRAAEQARNAARINDLELRLTSRLDQAGGLQSGARSSIENARARMTVTIGMISVAAAIAAILIGALVH